MICLFIHSFIYYRNEGTLDLEALVILWAKAVRSTTKESHPSLYSQYEQEDLKYDIRWDKVKIHHHDPVFNDVKYPPSPKSQVSAMQ